jgi:hypothetical protein
MPQPTESLKHFCCWLFAFFLMVFGAYDWVAWLYGSPMPYWDQWDEAINVFKPWAEGRLEWTDLLTPSNDHRPILTYLLDLGLIWLNGRWDPFLQMMVDGWLHAVYAAGLAFSLWHFGGRRHGWWICALLLPFFTLPFAGENEIWGYMSQWHFAQLFGLGTIVGMGFFRAGSTPWWLGVAAAALGLLSMASGPFAPLAVVGLCGLRAIKQRRGQKDGLVTVAFCLALAGMGMAIRVPMTGHQPLHAHSLAEFSSAMIRHLAWPYFQSPWMAVVVLLPLAALLASYLRGQEPALAAELPLTLALWSLIYSAALAYGRANYGEGIPASRYTEVFSLLLITSLYATVRLATHGPRAPLAQWHGVLPLVFACLLVWGLWKITELTVSSLLTQIRLTNLTAEERVEVYAVSRNEQEFLTPPTVSPNPRMALELLSDPRMQSILPAVCVPPAAVKTSGLLTVVAGWLLARSPALVLLGGAMFAGLCVYGLARRTLGITAQKPEELFVLAALLGTMCLLASQQSWRRDAIDYRLESYLAFNFNFHGMPARAAIHQQKADELKSRPGLPH